MHLDDINEVQEAGDVNSDVETEPGEGPFFTADISDVDVDDASQHLPSSSSAQDKPVHAEPRW